MTQQPKGDHTLAVNLTDENPFGEFFDQIGQELAFALTDNYHTLPNGNDQVRDLEVELTLTAFTKGTPHWEDKITVPQVPVSSYTAVREKVDPVIRDQAETLRRKAVEERPDLGRQTVRLVAVATVKQG